MLERYGQENIGARSLQRPEVHKKAVENSRKTREQKYGSVVGAMLTPKAIAKAKESRSRTIKAKQEIRKTSEFQEWYLLHSKEYKTEWIAVGHYYRLYGKS